MDSNSLERQGWNARYLGRPDDPSRPQAWRNGWRKADAADDDHQRAQNEKGEEE